ncbi:arginine deiminase family protein [Salinispira pacifica]|uniref:arginine deiminase n=1 Tax=Salinispira pacifica TaxID=1307761 RepID=V5WEM6_9SPIO|nr:arginine deiminase family protein [Salinispira pacifica]AHC13616.1 Arginine deiminase [Salinispira pacifica]
MKQSSFPVPFLHSEIGRLESVIMHRPGPEVESVTPDSAHEQLYNEIIPLQAVQSEYSMLWNFMNRVSNVLEIGDLLTEALGHSEAKRFAIKAVVESESLDGSKYEEVTERLDALSPGELSRAMIQGLDKSASSFQDHLDTRLYDLSPLPNFYFMRDSAMAYRESVLVGGMAHGVRRNESVIQEVVWNHLSDPETVVYSGLRHQRAWPETDIRLEGGDFLVADSNLLIIGISERTSPQAIDALVRSVMNMYEEPLDVLAVNLPLQRATIHLDMIFTYLDQETALVYEPLVTGPKRARCTHGHFALGKEPRFTDYQGLPDALEALGRGVKTVKCGGDDIHFQQREQWFAGTNVFAFGPGKIVSYESNIATIEALSSEGYRVLPVSADEPWEKLADSDERLVVTVPGIELARGGGGLRCMTMPVRRTAL